MKIGQKKRLLGGIKRTRTMWEKLYEAVNEEERLQNSKDITVQCIDFCEATTSEVHAAQKRPAGPILSRSPISFVFNDVVGLDQFFLNTYEKHTLLAMNIVCWGTGLQRVILLRDQSGETLRNAYRNNWLRSYGRPRTLVRRFRRQS